MRDRKDKIRGSGCLLQVEPLFSALIDTGYQIVLAKKIFAGFLSTEKASRRRHHVKAKIKFLMCKLKNDIQN
jgi:hypothetical protein